MNGNRKTLIIIACIIVVYFAGLAGVLHIKTAVKVTEPPETPSDTAPVYTDTAPVYTETTPPPTETEPPAPAGIEGELKLGNVVTYGSYEQDADLDNGSEPLEWDVIGQNGDYYLLITHYVIDGKPFSDSTSDHVILANDDATAKQLTWAKSSIRRWLNEDFYDIAFDGCDTSMIETVHLETPNFRSFAGKVSDTYNWFSESELKKMDSIGGDDTEDMVFLLSYDEFAQCYAPVDSRFPGKKQCGASIVSPTAYAVEQGVEAELIDKLFGGYGEYGTELSPYYTEEIEPYVNSDYKENGSVCSWLTRSPGVYQGGVSALVIQPGYVCFDPAGSKGQITGIRPAIWVKG